MAGKKPGSPARKVAFCGIFAALTIIILYFGGQTVLDLSILVLCSAVTVLVLIETDIKTGIIYSLVTSTLALLLLPSKLYAVQYLLFSTLYPLIKPYAERLPKAIAFILKIAVLDAMLVLCIILGRYILMAGEEFFTLNVITLVLGTLFFALYDYALSKAMVIYTKILRKRLGIGKFLS